jgi:hypothetical protein
VQRIVEPAALRDSENPLLDHQMPRSAMTPEVCSGRVPFSALQAMVE